MPFPTIATVLDDFNRAALGANWTNGTYGDANLAISGSTVLTGNGFAAGYLNTANYGPGIEFYADVVSFPASSFLGFMYHLNSGGSDAAPNGYEFVAGTGTSNANLERIDSGSNTVIGSSFTLASSFAAGDKVGVSVSASNVHSFYLYTAGAWGAAITTRSESTYTSGHFGFELFTNTIQVDNMSGGTISSGSSLSDSTTLGRTEGFSASSTTGSQLFDSASALSINLIFSADYAYNRPTYPKYAERVMSVSPSTLTDLWVLSETSGSVAYNLITPANFGTYLSPVVLGAYLGPDRVNYAPGFGASGARINPLTGGYASTFTGTKGTIFGCAKVANLGVWTDGTVRQTFHHQSGPSNEIAWSRSAVDNSVRINYTAGSTANILGGVTVVPTTEWFTWAITFADFNNGNLANGWMNGFKVGTDLTPNGVWSGTILTGNPGSWIGDKGTADAGLWSGSQAYIGRWSSVLSQSDLLYLSDLREISYAGSFSLFPKTVMRNRGFS